MARRMVVGTMWGFVALALVGGIVIGAVLPLWQRAALQNDMRVLQKRLADAEAGSGDADKQIEDLTEQVASLEASSQALAQTNAELTSELATLRAAQAQVATATPTQTSTSKGTAPVITEHSVTPSTVVVGGSVTMLVKTQGATDKATMRVDGPSGSSYDKTFSLKKVATEGAVTTWRTVLTAPGAGTYRCIAAASKGSARTTASVIQLTVN
jgi:uncharacterized membrane-anchored protein YhcB (DUF1043 family)